MSSRYGIVQIKLIFILIEPLLIFLSILKPNVIFIFCIITAIIPIIFLFYIFSVLYFSLSFWRSIRLISFPVLQAVNTDATGVPTHKKSNIAYVSLGLYILRRSSILVRLVFLDCLDLYCGTKLIPRSKRY